MARRRLTAVIPGRATPSTVIPGRAERREPGIHNPKRWLWIPGSLATLGPRNDSGEVGRVGMTADRAAERSGGSETSRHQPKKRNPRT